MNKKAALDLTPEMIVKFILGAVLILLFLVIAGKHIIPLILWGEDQTDAGEFFVEIMIMLLILIVYDNVVWILARIGLIE